MGRLTPEKVRWIIQAKKRGLGAKEVAWSQGVTVRRVQQLWKAHRETGEIPVLRAPGRPKEAFTMDEVNAILDAHQTYDLGAIGLEKILVEQGKKISHNRIHKVLKAAKKAEDEPKKQKRRKWVRYERDHSMSMWHTDWKQLPNGNWFIAFMDDASRFIVNYGEFPERNQANVFVVLDEAIARYGCPDEILSDRGSEFYANKNADKTHGTSQFTLRLNELGIKHIVARVNHPQTNGKLERFHGEIEKRWKRWDGDVRKIVDWHNHLKPHMSLKFNRAERPAQAFVRKYPPERVVQSIAPWFWS
jgi:putative transposase